MNGQLGTPFSSRRFKENILDLGAASNRLYDLRPVTFNYKAEYGGGGVQYGLIAEEVDQVMSEMTIRDQDGQLSTVAYQLLPPLLLNETQKHQKRLDSLQADNDTLRAELAALKAELDSIKALLKP